MNVSELRQRIFDQMDYFPDLQQYRDSVVRRLNDRYLELCDSAHWLFLQKEVELQIRAPITGSSTITLARSSANHRLLTASGFTPTLEMLGQTLTLNTDSSEYTIVRVVGSSIYINTEFSDSSATDFTITFDRYLLPDDCIEILGVVDRNSDRGRLLQIDRRREEFAYLDKDQSGDPSVVVEDEHIQDDPPFNNPTAGLLPTSSPTTQFLPNNTYEYKYTLYREGRESPPSLPVQVTTGAVSTVRIAISNLDDTGWYATASSTSSDSGVIKLIYRRDVTNDGRWFLVGSAESTVVAFVDERVDPRDAFAYQNNASFRYTSRNDYVRFVESGPRQYVRFWFTSDLDKKIHLRYHYRPATLVAETDSPQLPRQYHHLLVYMTLQEMFMQMQDTTQAQLFERRAQQLLVQLRRRYLTRDDVKKRFMRFDRPRRFKNVYGAPTISN